MSDFSTSINICSKCQMNFSGLKKRNLWQFFFLITYKYQAQLFGMCIDLKNRQRVKEIETRDRELSWLELILWLLIATLITRLFILALVQYSERIRISQSPKDKVNMPIIQKLKCDTVYTISYSHLSATLA